MEYLINPKLSYITLEADDNLYDDVDLEKQDCVDARYWERNGHTGKPDICALPRAATAEEIPAQNSIPIPGYDRSRIAVMPKDERMRQLYEIKKVRYPLPFHAQIESHLSMSLISSYASRKSGITQIFRRQQISGEEKETNIISCTEGISSNVMGFTIVGTSGTGKSTAFDLAAAKYPRAIRHNMEEGAYIQIPIMKLNAYANSNLSALFLSMARQLDRILDCGEEHVRMISAKKSNLGQIISMVCSWIELYHIGVLAIDEIQLLDFNQKSAKSFENFLTITASTGVALVCIGTPEACEMWNSELRIQRRMGSVVIRADSYCKDRDYVEWIIKKLWKYQWLDEAVPLTSEMLDVMYEESCGSIDFLTSLWMMMQFEVLGKKKMPVIDAEYIRFVSNKYFSEMKELLKDSLVQSESRFLDLRSSMLDQIGLMANIEGERRVSKMVQAEAKRNIEQHYDREMVLGEVTEVIQCCRPEYSRMQISKAFVQAEKDEAFVRFRKQERVQRVLAILNKVSSAGRKASVPRQEKEKKTDIEFLENALKDSQTAAGGIA